jgi:hypothetical protein
MVKNGPLRPEHYAALREGFELRSIADYSAQLRITEAEARSLLASATHFVEDAEACLRV